MSLSRHCQTSHIGDDLGVIGKTNIHNLHNRDDVNVERTQPRNNFGFVLLESVDCFEEIRSYCNEKEWKGFHVIPLLDVKARKISTGFQMSHSPRFTLGGTLLIQRL